MKKLLIAVAVLGLTAPLFAQAPEAKTETAAPIAAEAPAKAEKKAAKAEKKAAKKAAKAEKKAAKKAAAAEKKGGKSDEAPKAPAADAHAGH